MTDQPTPDELLEDQARELAHVPPDPIPNDLPDDVPDGRVDDLDTRTPEEI